MKNTKNQYWWIVIGITMFLASCSQPETTSPVRKNFEDAVFASGHLEQEQNYTVSAKVDGIVQKLPVKEGDPVRKYDLIAVIENEVQDNQLTDALTVYNDAVNNASPESPQLQHIQTQIDQANKQLAFDKENYLRYKDLYAKKSVAKVDFEKVELQYKAAQNNLRSLEKNYEEAQTALKLNEQRSLVQVNTQRTLLKDYKLKTEAAGTVIEVFKKQGELARRGEPIANIGSGAYVIHLFVAEDDITKVDPGQSVAVQLNTYPDSVFQAMVTKIHPGFNQAEQSYVVEARFSQLPKKLFSGTQLQANIETGSRENVLVIPTNYLSKGNYVMLQKQGEQQIVIGTKTNAWTEVVSGLSETDVIIKPKS
jgi:macrolide-specific efflux system membrane fusion protein